jgi:hypothetical protein
MRIFGAFCIPVVRPLSDRSVTGRIANNKSLPKEGRCLKFRLESEPSISAGRSEMQCELISRQRYWHGVFGGDIHSRSSR